MSNKSNKQRELEFIQKLVDEMPSAIFYKDSDLIYKVCNQAFSDYIEIPKEKIIGATVYDVATKELAEVYHEADLQLLEEKKHQVYETYVKGIESEGKLTRFSKSIIYDECDNPQGILGVIEDISDKYNDQRRLDMLYRVKDAFLSINKGILNYASEREFFKKIQTKLQPVFDACNFSTVLKLDDEGYLSILVNSGYIQDQSDDFKLKLTDSFIYEKCEGNVNQSVIINNLQYFIEEGVNELIDTQEGNAVMSELMIPLILNGKLSFIIAMDSEEDNAYTETDRLVAEYIREELPIIYRIYELHHQTVKLSRYDGLTGLYNRRTFDRILDSRLDFAEVTHEKIVLALLDLDKLKGVNDRYGHLAGDTYITALKDLILSIQNERIYVGRIGGDEFAIMFSNYEQRETKDILIEMQDQFSKEKIVYEEVNFKGSFSFGIAEYGNDGSKKVELFRAADKRMYEDKQR